MVLVQHILEAARKRLAVLSWDASPIDVAKILENRNTPLVVVCRSDGTASGVISRTDIIKLLACAGTDLLCTNAGAIATKSIVSCHVDQPLQEVWAAVSARSLRCAPVLDDDGRAEGIVHARDVAIALLDEVSQEEVLLRDYVLGIGYQ